MSLRKALGCIIYAAVWLSSIDFATGFPTQLDNFGVNLDHRGQSVENGVNGVVSHQSEEPYSTRDSVLKHEDDSAVESLTESMEDWASDRSLSQLTATDTGSDSSQLYLGPHDPFEPKEQLDGYNAGRKPVFAIAHRVLTIQGMKDAVAHGANALEIGMRGWSSWGRKGWYCDHDGTITSPGDKAEDMFRAIQDQRRNGKTINFVWLDLKKPDEYKAGENAIERLRDLARKYLQPWGVRVLYGFYRSHVDGRAFGVIRDNHNYLH